MRLYFGSLMLIRRLTSQRSARLKSSLISPYTCAHITRTKLLSALAHYFAKKRASLCVFNVDINDFRRAYYLAVKKGKALNCISKGFFGAVCLGMS